MRVERLGDRLAVVIPPDVATTLAIKAGDEVELSVVDLSRRQLQELQRAEALDFIARAKWTLPPGYKFDREEANAR